MATRQNASASTSATPTALAKQKPTSDAVKSALRVLLIVELLTEESQGLTFSEICQKLELPKSSTYSLLRTMVDRGHLVLDPETRAYRIGIRIWQAGQTFSDGIDLAGVSRPFMQSARDQLEETVQLAVLDGVDNVYIAKVEADQQLILRSRIGIRLPAYATGLGKVLLAGLPDDEVIRRYKSVKFEQFTPRTLANLDQLLAALDEIRHNGFGIDLGEFTAGVRCVAVPVRNHLGEVSAAMSVSIPDVRATATLQRKVLKVLKAQATSFSLTLGWSGP